MQIRDFRFDYLLPLLIFSHFCESVIGETTEKSNFIENHSNVDVTSVFGKPVYWGQDCGSAAFPGLLKLSGCESADTCNLKVGSNYSFRYEWKPAQDYERLDYFISAVKLFPHEQFMFIHGSDGSYKNGSVFVQQEVFHVNETFRGNGHGWSILFVKEINGTMDVCNVFEVNIVNTLLNSTTGKAYPQVNIINSTVKLLSNENSSIEDYPCATKPPPAKIDIWNSTEASESVTPLMISNGPLICSQEDVFGDPSNCTAFHYCILDSFTGQFYDMVLHCPADLVFCNESKMCDHKEVCPCTQNVPS